MEEKFNYIYYVCWWYVFASATSQLSSWLHRNNLSSPVKGSLIIGEYAYVMDPYCVCGMLVTSVNSFSFCNHIIIVSIDYDGIIVSGLLATHRFKGKKNLKLS